MAKKTSKDESTYELEVSDLEQVCGGNDDPTIHEEGGPGDPATNVVIGGGFGGLIIEED